MSGELETVPVESETTFSVERGTGGRRVFPVSHLNGVSRSTENELYDRLDPILSNGKATPLPSPTVSTSSHAGLIHAQTTRLQTKFVLCLKWALPVSSIIVALTAFVMSTLIISGKVSIPCKHPTPSGLSTS